MRLRELVRINREVPRYYTYFIAMVWSLFFTHLILYEIYFLVGYSNEKLFLIILISSLIVYFYTSIIIINLFKKVIEYSSLDKQKSKFTYPYKNNVMAFLPSSIILLVYLIISYFYLWDSLLIGYTGKLIGINVALEVTSAFYMKFNPIIIASTLLLIVFINCYYLFKMKSISKVKAMISSIVAIVIGYFVYKIASVLLTFTLGKVLVVFG